MRLDAVPESPDHQVCTCWSSALRLDGGWLVDQPGRRNPSCRRGNEMVVVEALAENDDHLKGLLGVGGEHMTTLDDAAQLGAKEQGLAVISTLRADGTIQSSVVNAGVMRHPLVEQRVLAFVTYGKVKLANLRARAQLTATFRSGWQWVAVEGDAQLVGPDDPHPEIDSERLRLLLREAFVGAGGHHDNWAEYDRVMVEQRRTLVLIEPVRIYSN